MPEIVINGRRAIVPDDVTVAVAVLYAGQHVFRRSLTGEPRGPLCGMGVCYECRVTIDGVEHARSCQIPCLPRMIIETA